MTRILITGATGYLGGHLCNQIKNRKADIFGIYKNKHFEFENIDLIKIDLIENEEINLFFADFKPDYVFHLAAVVPSQITNVDENYVKQINVEVTRKITSLCKSYNSFLIFTSSDLVYDEGDSIDENSPLNPLTLYAQTKLEAEKYIQEKGKFFIILRTALLYGFSITHHKSFFDISFKKLQNGKTVKAFYDQYRCPLFVEEAAKFLTMLLDIKLKNDIMNFCGNEKLSRYEMLKTTAKVFKLNESLIQLTSCTEFSDYKMVKNLGLINSKMHNLGFFPNIFSENILYLKENFLKYKKFLESDER